MVHLFLAEGFEEIEALTVVDILRRAGVDIKTVSISDKKEVIGSNGIRVVADALFDDIASEVSDMLILPGGVPGAFNLNDHQGLQSLLLKQHAEGKWIAAICAAPLVLGGLGILEGKKATCYPGFEEKLKGAVTTGTLTAIDGNVITGKGPAAAIPFAFSLVEHLCGNNAVEELQTGMLYKELLG